MKKKFSNRKKFEQVAVKLGIQDKTHHVVFTDPVTKKDHMLLINNFSRFVNGMLKLSPSEQLDKLKQFEANMEELIKKQQEFRKELQEEADKIKIEDPMLKALKESEIVKQEEGAS